MTVLPVIQGCFFFVYSHNECKGRPSINPVGRRIQTLCFFSAATIHSDYPLSPIICCRRSPRFALILISPRFTQILCQNTLEEMTHLHTKHDLPVNGILAGVRQGIFRWKCDITCARVLGPCCHNRIHLLKEHCNEIF